MERVTTAPEILLEAGPAYLEFACLRPNDNQFMFEPVPSRDRSGEQGVVANPSLLFAIERGFDSGELVLFRGHDSRRAATQCWVAVHGTASLLPTVHFDEYGRSAPMARQTLRSVADFTISSGRGL
jgi:hypothetical protein